MAVTEAIAALLILEKDRLAALLIVDQDTLTGLEERVTQLQITMATNTQTVADIDAQLAEE